MIEALRAAYTDSRCRHVVVPTMFSEELALQLRPQVDAFAFVQRDLPDRARFEHVVETDPQPLFDELIATVADIVEARLALAHARWIRMRHRDYQLIKDDAADRPLLGRHVEVTLDFSAAATGQAELVYTDGHESWPVPQLPGALVVVGREDWLYRYARYLNHTVGDAVVHRLRLSLGYVG